MPINSKAIKSIINVTKEIGKDILFSKAHNIAKKKLPSSRFKFVDLIKGKKVVAPNDFGKNLKAYYDRATAIGAREKDRKALRKVLVPGKFKTIRALGDKRYRGMLSKHTKQYGNEVVRDFAHPIKSLKRQSAMITHHVDPETGRTVVNPLLRRAAVGSFLWGLPVMYSLDELTSEESKTRSKGENIARSAANLLPGISPKALPSTIGYEIPNLIFGAGNRNVKKEDINGYNQTIPDFK